MFTSTPAQRPVLLPPGKCSRQALPAASHSAPDSPQNYLCTLLPTLQNPEFKKNLPSGSTAVVLELLLVPGAISAWLFPWNWGCLPRATGSAWARCAARQDTDAQRSGQCTPKRNNSLLFPTLPYRHGTLNSEELAHPKIQKKSLFVRENPRDCYIKAFPLIRRSLRVPCPTGALWLSPSKHEHNPLLPQEVLNPAGSAKSEHQFGVISIIQWGKVSPGWFQHQHSQEICRDHQRSSCNFHNFSFRELHTISLTRLQHVFLFSIIS